MSEVSLYTPGCPDSSNLLRTVCGVECLGLRNWGGGWCAHLVEAVDVLGDHRHLLSKLPPAPAPAVSSQHAGEREVERKRERAREREVMKWRQRESERERERERAFNDTRVVVSTCSLVTALSLT